MGGVVMPKKEAVAKEKEFSQKALELDPELPEAHLSLACALGGAFDWRNAQIEPRFQELLQKVFGSKQSRSTMEPAVTGRERRPRPRGLASGDVSQSTYSPS